MLRAAQLSRAHGMQQLKLYMMVGLPGETDADIDELARFGLELAGVAGRLVLGIAPFVAKRKTPLDGAPFEDIAVLDARLARLRAAVKGRVTLRPTSPKWAWVEYRLAQGGFAAGHAAARAARAGAPLRRLEGGVRGSGTPAGRRRQTARAPPPPAAGGVTPGFAGFRSDAAIASISTSAPWAARRPAPSPAPAARWGRTP